MRVWQCCGDTIHQRGGSGRRPGALHLGLRGNRIGSPGLGITYQKEGNPDRKPDGLRLPIFFGGLLVMKAIIAFTGLFGFRRSSKRSVHSQPSEDVSSPKGRTRNPGRMDSRGRPSFFSSARQGFGYRTSPSIDGTAL